MEEAEPHMKPFTIAPASARDLRTVLRIVFAEPRQTAEALEQQVSAFIQYARELSLSLDRLWLATAGGRRLSACACLESPGRTAVLLLPSGAAPCADHTVFHALVEAAVQDQSARGTRLLQCLLEPGDDWSCSALKSAGFRDLTTLLYLERHGGQPSPVPVNPVESAGRQCQWMTYDAECHADFTTLISATYRDSLDCRGLSGLRDIEDVVAGHKSAGRFDPRRWLLLKFNNIAVGCILFGENPLRSAIDLVYMGVHPAFRGRGLGRYILNYGLTLPQNAGFAAVTVAVDHENTPALALYAAGGFTETHRRVAMLRVLRATSGES